jgi:hypothetical protein
MLPTAHLCLEPVHGLERNRIKIVPENVFLLETLFQPYQELFELAAQLHRHADSNHSRASTVGNRRGNREQFHSEQSPAPRVR